MELWTDIVGYEGIYLISSFGRVQNAKTGMVLAPKVNKGYCMVNLYRDHRMKTFSIHRLVAAHFIPNPCHKEEVNHLDEDKLNNYVENLAWVTPKENSNWGTRNERISKYVKSQRHRTKGVVQIDRRTGMVIGTYESISEAAKVNGFHQGNISWCCLGKKNIANGYIWRYAS